MPEQDEVITLLREIRDALVQHHERSAVYLAEASKRRGLFYLVWFCFLFAVIFFAVYAAMDVAGQT